MATKFSVTTPQQILNSPLNDSKAKYHWSFGKANRFGNNKANCPVSFYEYKSTRSKRSASFGYGNRVSFTLTTDSPSPVLYETHALFKKSQRNSRGTKFGKGRSECTSSSYIDMGRLKNPGPSDYSLNKNETIAFSMRPKTAYPRDYFIADYEKNVTPGPGTYESLETIDKKGENVTSRKPNPSRVTLDTKSKRFWSTSITPGPGHYDDKNSMSKTGEYILSINKSDGKRAFGMERRELKLDGNRMTPGPGYYRKPSDFGHYESELHPDMLQTFNVDKPSAPVSAKRPMTARR